MTPIIKDPIIELSGIFVSILQVTAAFFGGLFLWLSIMAFNGHAMINMVLELVEAPGHVDLVETFFAGIVLLVLFMASVVVFFVLKYLRKVVNREFDARSHA
ncbi:hypothetical protein FKX85_04675 [Echinicola soli]|uniref:Uncharacterized protein n=1 Tax=Echinicola soli TaxID=2591634 RepID=A0A514CEX3_9BACT|nr:hypothetical protein [Echinicola soli]QDH78372.1 hypothetical protein FKX85_04675 [Echinicola soli]